LGSLHPQAEDALFFAGNQTEFLPIVASHSSKKLEKISIPDSAGWWFQLYLHTERQASRRLLDKAVSRGASAIVFTVDLPVVGYRDSSRQFFNKSGKNLLPGQANSEYPSLGKVTKAPDQEEHLRLWDRVLDPSINVADLSWVIEKSGLPTYVKGVMREEEAETYLKMGAAGIIVSNHGGRALESAPSTASRVELVRSALGPQATILVDGGIRRGDDVAKALCLGADMVLVGRPYAWGLAAGGALGLQRSLEILWAELRVTMAFLGARTLGDLNRKLIA
jgi:4-hydroxymandelate oxidase